MPMSLGLRIAALAAVVSFGMIGQLVLAESAAAVTPTQSELKNGQLRLQGKSAPGVFVIARSTTSAASVRADPTGFYKIQAANFTAPDCKITIADGRTPTATVTLVGCTVSVKPPVPTPAAPTGTCKITPQATANLAVGKSAAVSFATTGCNTTFNSGATPTPVQWKVVAGSIPTGMSGPASQGTTGGNIIGTPSVLGTYTFTLQVTDQVGATDQENVTVTVKAA